MVVCDRCGRERPISKVDIYKFMPREIKTPQGYKLVEYGYEPTKVQVDLCEDCLKEFATITEIFLSNKI